MRSIWKGSVSFGLVTIPVRLYSATEEKDVSFHQVHRTDGGRIRYRRVCSIDGEEVQYNDIAKGYQLPDGEIVILTDDDFADLPLATAHTIEVLQFVPLEQVDPMYFARSYYLAPEAAGTKPYVLLREALEQSGRIALVKVALRQRESLAALRVRDGVFVLEMMLWPDEIRTPEFDFLDEDIKVRSQELSMATSLIETLAGDFAPEEFTDNYREALEALIEAKVEGREVVTPEQPADEGGKVVDLMSALRASVEAARERRGESGEVSSKSTAKRASGGLSRASSSRSGRKRAAATTSAAKRTSKSTAKRATKSSAKSTAKSAKRTQRTQRKSA
ncbi:MAG TPA: Ku protein [Mycobacteriales bacterium]|nr:Ku protein [Mycobacteriales bacterium]